MRSILSPTAARLLHNLHPRQMSTYATLQTLQNAVCMTPGRDQKKANRMGDAFSRKESSTILEQVCEDYDAPALALKKGVESLYLGKMRDATERQRAAAATKWKIFGFQFFGDNIGMVSKVVHLTSPLCHHPCLDCCWPFQLWAGKLQLLPATDHAASHRE